MRDDLTGFEHLHPALAAGGTWTVRVRPAEAGSYRVFTQFTGLPAGKPVSLVLSRPLTVTGPAAPPAPLPAPAATTQVAGYTLTVTGHPEAGRDSALTVTVTRHGHPVTSLQPYLGTYAHLTAFHQGDLGFARPAFPGSALWFLGNPTAAGMHAGTLTFTTSTPGAYHYLCPVPGHAQKGMFGTFTVSSTT